MDAGCGRGHLKFLSGNQAKSAIPQVFESRRVEQVLWGKEVRVQLTAFEVTKCTALWCWYLFQLALSMSAYLNACSPEGGPVGLTWATRPFLSLRAGIRLQASNLPALGKSVFFPFMYQEPLCFGKREPTGGGVVKAGWVRVLLPAVATCGGREAPALAQKALV